MYDDRNTRPDVPTTELCKCAKTTDDGEEGGGINSTAALCAISIAMLHFHCVSKSSG